MHVISKLFSWSSFWINNQNIRPPLMINHTSPYGMHPNLQKIPKQCKAKIKVITCDNVIFVLVPTHQPIHNFVSNCMFNILMTFMTMQFHFLHKLGLCISQTPNLHSSYQKGLASKYYWMGEYFPIYFTIILSTHKFCFAFQNCPHNPLHVSTNHLVFVNFVIG
jgi:hypothetical protein